MPLLLLLVSKVEFSSELSFQKIIYILMSFLFFMVYLHFNVLFNFSLFNFKQNINCKIQMSLLGKQLDFISLCQFRRKFDFRMYPIHVRMQKASIVVTAEKSTLFIQQKRGEEGGTRRRNYLQRILFTQGTKNLDYIVARNIYQYVKTQSPKQALEFHTPWHHSRTITEFMKRIVEFSQCYTTTYLPLDFHAPCLPAVPSSELMQYFGLIW